MPASRQATGVGFPCAIDTSIWRSSVTICSALNLFFGMTQAPFQAHCLTTLGSKKPGQVSRALSAHKTASAYAGYAKRTMERTLSATRKRHAHLLANAAGTSIQN